MGTFKAPYLKPADIARRAEEFLARRNQTEVIPVPIEHIVERMGVDIVPVPNLMRTFHIDGWTTHERLHFLRSLPEKLETPKMTELDLAFHLTTSTNAEILSQWLLMAVRSGYGAADQALVDFLTRVGRRKFLKPLYAELAKTQDGKARARLIYSKARAGYHAIARETIEGILK